MDENCLICYKSTPPDASDTDPPEDKSYKLKLGQTICSLLNLPLSPFVDLFQSSNICPECVQRVWGIEGLLRELSSLQQRISESRNDLEKLLFESQKISESTPDGEKLEGAHVQPLAESLNNVNRRKIVEKLNSPREPSIKDSEDDPLVNYGVEAVLSEGGRNEEDWAGFGDDHFLSGFLEEKTRPDKRRKPKGVKYSDQVKEDSSGGPPEDFLDQYMDDEDSQSRRKSPRTSKSKVQTEQVLEASGPSWEEEPEQKSPKKVQKSSKKTASKNKIGDIKEICGSPGRNQVDIPCPQCSFIGKNIIAYKSHINQAHGIRQKHICPVCNAEMSNGKKFENHILREHEGIKSYPCDLCDKSFALPRYLIDHKRLHEGGIPLKSCKICSFKSNTSSNILRHYQRWHAPKKEATLAPENSRGCPKCDFKGKNEKSLASHILQAHKTRDKKEYFCAECNRKFVSPSKFEDHKRSHDKLRPYICDACGKTYTTSKNLREHQRYHGLGKPLIKCPECEFHGLSERALQRHVNIVHKKEKSFQCEFCPQAFSRASRLKEHQNFHHLQIRNTCVTCGKEFLTKTGLKEHEMRHDPKSLKGRVLACTEGGCSKFFLRNATLQRHILEDHKGIKSPNKMIYTCVYCDRRFNRPFLLERHKMSQHNHVKPYSCRHCAKRFPTEWYLKRHEMQTHGSDEDKKHECGICNKKYAVKEALYFHNLHHHPELVPDAEEKLARKKTGLPRTRRKVIQNNQQEGGQEFSQISNQTQSSCEGPPIGPSPCMEVPQGQLIPPGPFNYLNAPFLYTYK